MSMATFGMGGFEAEGGSASELIPVVVRSSNMSIEIGTNMKDTVVSQNNTQIEITVEFEKTIKQDEVTQCLIPPSP